MFFQNRRYMLYLVIWLIFSFLFLYLDNLAWSQPNQDCVYKNNISYNSNGQIIDAIQSYECKTPQVEKIVHVENQSRYYYNTKFKSRPFNIEKLIYFFIQILNSKNNPNSWFAVEVEKVPFKYH